MKISKLRIVLIMFLFAIFLPGCSSSSNDSSSDVSDTGTLSLNLTDATTGEYQAVYVTIDEVQVHLGDIEDDDGDNNWVTAATPQQTYNLLELTNGVMENLGVTDLEAGIYTQLRLYLGSNPDPLNNILNEAHEFPNYVIDKDDDEVHELKAPSGYQSGIKLVHEFDIVSGLTVDLVLDFDASTSVVKAGASGQYLLKPTIKVIDTVNDANITGTVNDINQQEALSGVTVSAQSYSMNAPDLKDKVEIIASTFTDETGEFMMYLEPGTYNIVASTPGRNPVCTEVTVELDGEYTQDFDLTSADTRNVHTDVSITDSDESTTATLSFRQTGQCIGDIEVYAANVVPGEYGYDVELPLGNYKLVASSEGQATQLAAFTIVGTGMETVEIVFP